MMRLAVLIVMCVTAALLQAQEPNASRAPSRPHIVMFLSDDHGVDYVGCYGNRAIRTPNIDALAASGQRYTKVFAASPTCVPSRSILYTGLHSARNGAMGNHTETKPGVQSLPDYLRPLGYRVVLANKTHVKPESVYDFEYLKATLPRNPKHVRRYRQEGLDTAAVDRFLAEHAREGPDQPLCLIVADNGPHVVWEPNRTYDPATLPLPPTMVDTPITRRALANYYQDITSTDARLGEVMASLKKHGYDDKTLLIYTTDQGAEWPHAKWTVYDAGLHVPFVARWPGVIRPGTTSAAMISFVDVMPTFVELAGGKAPAGIDGKSFRAVLLGEAEKFREEIYASHTRDGDMNVFPQRCVRDERWKYVLNLMPGNKWTTHFTLVPGIPESHAEVYGSWVEAAKSDAKAARLVKIIEQHPAEELYDTANDPHELENLAARPEHADRLAAMRKKVLAWMEQQQDPALTAARALTEKR